MHHSLTLLHPTNLEDLCWIWLETERARLAYTQISLALPPSHDATGLRETLQRRHLELKPFFLQRERGHRANSLIVQSGMECLQILVSLPSQGLTSRNYSLNCLPPLGLKIRRYAP